MIGPRAAARYRGAKLDAFRKGEQLSSFGLAGFWRYACERFFVLEEHMKATGLMRCLHIESDNLLYVSPDAYDDWLQATYGSGIAVCQFQEALDSAGVLYVGSLEALVQFNEALLELVRLAPERFAAIHGPEMPNEMRMLNILRREAKVCDALPIDASTALRMNAPVVFDPASYGQFVDGWYWNPGVPYISDEHLLGSQLASGQTRIVWDAHRTAPYLLDSEGAMLALANLHIHSKRLDDWTSTDRARELKPAGFPSESTARARAVRAFNYGLGAASRVRQRAFPRTPD